MSQPRDKHNKGHSARLDVPELLWDFPSCVHLATIPPSDVLHPSRIPEVKHLSTSSLGGKQRRMADLTRQIHRCLDKQSGRSLRKQSDCIDGGGNCIWRLVNHPHAAFPNTVLTSCSTPSSLSRLGSANSHTVVHSVARQQAVKSPSVFHNGVITSFTFGFCRFQQIFDKMTCIHQTYTCVCACA